MSDMKNILAAFDSASKSKSTAATKGESGSMLDILTRFTLAESGQSSNESLDKNQKSVNQLSATFKPKTVSVLTAKTDPKNPMAGKLVGGCEESVENDKEVAEDLVTSMKRSLDDYLRGMEDKESDNHIFSAPKDREIGKRVKIDRDLIPKATVSSSEPTPKKAVAIVKNFDVPVKTIQIDDINECGIYGDEENGFEIRRGHKVLPTRFDSIDHASAAAEAFSAMRQSRNNNPDYREEK